ncbi:sodium:alanine symporter family protein [Crassaminicella thermophila]|uniref:Sodium:alanine symporter family protein n=1 Tax=Crassaminicella thermophila TaxID=2599308 RepID=A0A5C0SJD9_CRATE|nr:sodium:alanine symporter family protein [Crassaminicella thermophila]QEK13069.1 sodium:alanine symporter family protein [Crassaminicella thermophila]
MIALENFFKNLADLVWGNWLIVTLIGVGAYFTFITKFLQIRKLPYIFHETLIKPFKKGNENVGEGTLTPFQALCTALGSCVGNGNIVGVATAIVGGGPGAIFWMWLAGILGMATKYAEILLGMHYREKAEDGTYVGGPMYYISKGLKLPWLATIYSILLILQNSGGTLIQSNAVAVVVKDLFGITPIITALMLIFFVGLIIVGGIKRLGQVTEKLVPFMAGFYILGGFIIIFANIKNFPVVIGLIFKSAFTMKAGVAGAVGYSIRKAMRFGVARGLYSNEAGEGSAPVLHASAITDHPVRQALFGVTEVLIDTVFLCSITAFVVLVSGVLETGASPAMLVSIAFGQVHPLFRYIVGISMILFAFSSILAQWYFGNVALTYVYDVKKAAYFKYPFLCLIIVGSLSSLHLVWYIQDSILGLLIVTNLIAIMLLSPQVVQFTKEFFNSDNGYIKKIEEMSIKK